MRQAFLAMRLAICSLSIGLRYRGRLDLKCSEFIRLVKKTMNLAWCYTAFVPANHPSRIRSATLAAFASAVYDVLTDWKGLCDRNREVLRLTLLQFVSPDLCDIAIELYGKEMSGDLEPHGLDRGVDALRFILGVFGVTGRGSDEFDVVGAGRTLQAIDDLIDYESDVRCGDINFLTSPYALEVLSGLDDWMSRLPMRVWCERSLAFRIAVDRAVAKANEMRQRESLLGVAESDLDAPKGPDPQIDDHEPAEQVGSRKPASEIVDHESPEYAPS